MLTKLAFTASGGAVALLLVVSTADPTEPVVDRWLPYTVGLAAASIFLILGALWHRSD